MVCLTKMRKSVPTRRIWLVLLLLLGILNGCADEADEGRKLCKRFGPLCREASEGKEGEIYLSVYDELYRRQLPTPGVPAVGVPVGVPAGGNH